MGIKDLIQSLGKGRGAGTLTLTAAAEQEIRTRLESESETGTVAFFVVTEPAAIGFRVGVGFERVEEGKPAAHDRPLRPEFPVPVRISDEDWDRLAGYTIDSAEGKFMTYSDVTVHVGDTPNPDARKFLANRGFLTEGAATFSRPVSAADPALVRLLLEIPQVKSIFLVPDFCSVTRMPDADWDELVGEVGKRIKAYFAHGGAPVEPRPRRVEEYGEVEGRIVQLLDDVVRPAVQRDGGDIAFAGYDEGVVQLYMLGSCVGCPSSLATLKMGVERLLMEKIPEVTEVVAID